MAVPPGNDAPKRDQPVANLAVHEADHRKDRALTLPKRVVVVDDSRTIRAWLRHLIETDPQLSVVGEASSAQEARGLIKATNPDVITLDVEMPGMNGLEFLEKLIALRPMPVVMVSSSAQRGSDVAIKALSLGAVDCIVKPDHVMDAAAGSALTHRIFAAACSEVFGPGQVSAQARVSLLEITDSGDKLVLIGSSTGGVTALETVLSGLDAGGPPVVIAQHMPTQYLANFARRLNKILGRDIEILQAGEPLKYGQIRLAPGGEKQSLMQPEKPVWQAKFAPRKPKDLYCPSVDTLFHSACGRAASVTAVLLTGLGDDGANGLKALRSAGAHTIGQDCESSVVYGMPRAAFELGAVTEQMPLKKIAQAINRATLGKDLKDGAFS